jgi:hypothetical protein
MTQPKRVGGRWVQIDVADRGSVDRAFAEKVQKFALRERERAGHETRVGAT